MISDKTRELERAEGEHGERRARSNKARVCAFRRGFSALSGAAARLSRSSTRTTSSATEGQERFGTRLRRRRDTVLLAHRGARSASHLSGAMVSPPGARRSTASFEGSSWRRSAH